MFSIPSSTASRRFLRWMPWFLGTLAALALWPYLSLPFHPVGSSGGVPSLLGIHPLNSLLRFSVALFLPLAFLLFTYRVHPEAWKNQPQEQLDEKAESGITFPWELGVLAVLFALLVPTFLSSGPFDPYHEGESLGSSVSWENGAKPYQDFIMGHGVFEDPLRSVLAFKIWGTSIGAARAFQSILKTLTWVFLTFSVWFLLKRKTWASALFLCFLLCLYPGGLFRLFLAPWNPSLPWSESFLKIAPWVSPFEWVLLPSRHLPFFAFLALLAAWVSHPPKGFRLGILSFFLGFFPLSAFGYSLDHGFYLCALLFLAVPTAFLFTAVDQRKILGLSLLAGGGAGCLALHLLLRGAWCSFLNYIFIVVPKYKEWTDGIPYPVFEPGFLLALLLITSNLYRTGSYWLLLVAQNPESPFQEKLRLYLRKYGLEVLFSVAGLFLFRNALGRGDWPHVIYGILPSLLAAAAAITRLKTWELLEEKSWARYTARAVVMVFVLTAILRLSLGGEWNRNFPIHEPDNHFISLSYQQTLSELHRQMAPKDLFFTFASDATWYYLLRQPSPTRFPGIWFAWTPAFQQEAINDLERKKVRWVLYQNNDWSDRVDGITNSERLPLIDQYLKSHYHPHFNIGGHEIWIRNEDV